MPEDRAVVSVEFKTNLLAPARGERFRATARVVRSGRTLTVCAAEVVAIEGEQETLVAVMQATMIGLENRPGRSS
jgi:acyl-coenzyme A thioesterase PaaI-like protein